MIRGIPFLAPFTLLLILLACGGEEPVAEPAQQDFQEVGGPTADRDTTEPKAT